MLIFRANLCLNHTFLTTPTPQILHFRVLIQISVINMLKSMSEVRFIASQLNAPWMGDVFLLLLINIGF